MAMREGLVCSYAPPSAESDWRLFIGRRRPFPPFTYLFIYFVFDFVVVNASGESTRYTSACVSGMEERRAAEKQREMRYVIRV